MAISTRSLRLVIPSLLAMALGGCATTEVVDESVTVGSTVVVRSQDDSPTVLKALTRVQTDLDTVERRIQELEMRTRSIGPMRGPAKVSDTKAAPVETPDDAEEN